MAVPVSTITLLNHNNTLKIKLQEKKLLNEKRDLVADVSSVSPSLELKEYLWVVCCLPREDGAALLVANGVAKNTKVNKSNEKRSLILKGMTLTI